MQDNIPISFKTLPHFRQETLLHYSEDTNKLSLKFYNETEHKNAQIFKNTGMQQFSNIPI